MNLQIYKLQIQNLSLNSQAVWMNRAILWFAVAYILLCKLNYGYHNQARFHLCLQTEHVSAVKFNMGYEKNMSFLVIPKSPELWKKVEEIGLGFFK